MDGTVSEAVSTAQGLAAGAEETLHGKYLTFWTDRQLYGISIADVVQIIGVQEITEVPEFPSYAKGIINLRGNIIPIIDVRLRFGKMEAEHTERTCIIVTSIGGALVGFLVDGVEEVADIPDEEISEPPHMSGGYGSDFVTGIGKHASRVILLLEAQRILSGEQIEALTSTY